MENTEEMLENLRALLASSNLAQIKTTLSSMNAIDIAEIIDNVDYSYMPRIFRLLPKELAAEVFVEMDSETQQHLINSFNDNELKAVVAELFVDDTVDIIEEMPAAIVKRILRQADPEMRESVNKLLRYEKDSAGSIMTTEFVNLKQNMTVEESFAKIKQTGIDKETVYTCYVTDATNHLVGVVSARTLLISEKSHVIGDIMNASVISVNTGDDKEAVARQIQRYGFLAMPVTDAENRLVGIVTVDDALDVLLEENNEDFSKMSAVTPSTTPYLKTSVWGIALNRIPWLLLLMVSATFTSLIIGKYENVLTGISVTLFACVPMLMDTGGNAGSQASVTIIRGIALNEITFKDLWKVLRKEVSVSLLLGFAMAIVCFGKLMLIDSLYNPMTPMIALTVSLALYATIVIAKFIGGILPIIAKKCRLDPAVVASPFITTFVDALSLIIYCNIALGLLS